MGGCTKLLFLLALGPYSDAFFPRYRSVIVESDMYLEYLCVRSANIIPIISGGGLA